MLKKLYSDRKLLYIFLAVFTAGVIFIGIISPVYLDNVKEEWESRLQSKIEYIEKETTAELNRMQESVLKNESLFEDSLRQILSKENYKRDLLNYCASSSLTKKNEIFIFDENNELIGWNFTSLSSEVKLNNDRFKPGEVHFYTSSLITYFTVYDTLAVNDKIYSAALFLPVEKNYSIDNIYFNPVSLEDNFIKRFRTDFTIKYYSSSRFTNDGRKYAFDILNNFRNKIGLVEFQKPMREAELSRVKNNFDFAQSLFAAGGCLIYLLIILSYIRKIRSRLMKFIILSFSLAGLRYAVFELKIFRFLENWELHNSKYFSSLLGSGIVSSPLELFITLIFALIIILYGFNKARNYFRTGKNNSVVLSLIISVSLSVLFVVILRGLGASVRSIVFDSSLRYFKGVSLIPELPQVFMLVNLLLLGFVIVLFSLTLLLIIYTDLKKLNTGFSFRLFILFFAALEITGVLYGLTQNNPQLTFLIRFVFILLLFSVLWFLVRNKFSLYHYFLYAFIASVVSIMLLINFNTKLEQESLKTTAYELTRQKENLLRFAVYETLVESITSPEVINLYTSENVNPDAAAFKIWSRSILQRESLGCSVNFLNLKLERIGGFRFRFNKAYEGSWAAYQSEINELHDIKIISENIVYTDNKIIRGLATIENVEGLLGYVEVNVLYDMSSIGITNTPEFLTAEKDFLNETIDFSKLSIFDFHNGTLINSYSDYNLGENEILSILDAPLDQYNEAWLKLDFNKEPKLFFIIKTQQDDVNRLIAVGLKEKELSWGLFDFFKPFFVHSLFIIVLLLLYLGYKLTNRGGIKFNFSAKLLTSFLLISLIPLLLIAVMFRSLTSEKNTGAIEYKLEKRASSVESYIETYAGTSTLTPYMIYEKASNDLGIDYTLYKDGKFIYGTNNQYYQIGLIPKRINPEALANLYLAGMNNELIKEHIEDYKFNSLYYKTSILGEYYTIKVTDAFNTISVPLSGDEVDVFIFVSYSLAVLFILLIGYFLTKQFSHPIQNLTKATRSVAGGDLNVRLHKLSDDELGELVTGFNFMVDELRRSQSEIAELERETAWKEMAKQVAHEIKNPLTPMKLSVQQLIASYKDKSPKFDQIFEKVTNVLINQIETLKNIASEFSGFARMPNPKVELADIRRVISEAVNLFSEEKVTLNIDIIQNVPVEVDIDQLRRTFINLIRNSIQADATVVSVSALKKDENVEIKIADNGRGIPYELKEKVFDSNFTTKEKGMGLGLSMAKRSIENVNGEIFVSDTSDKGTIIIIKLPISK